MRHITRLALAAAVLAAAASLTACSSDPATTGTEAGSSTSSSASAASPAGAPEAKPKDEAGAAADVRITKAGVEDHEVWGRGAYVVHYKITNRGDGPADYIAEIEVLDADGDHLGQTGVTADKLGAGKSKEGDIGLLAAEVENGKLGDIASARVSKVDRT